jgi:hypothetical protein
MAEQSSGFSELREKAEKLLARQEPEKITSPTHMLELIHELEVHQTELEIQNEELRLAQEEISLLHHEFADLYEFSWLPWFSAPLLYRRVWLVMCKPCRQRKHPELNKPSTSSSES